MVVFTILLTWTTTKWDKKNPPVSKTPMGFLRSLFYFIKWHKYCYVCIHTKNLPMLNTYSETVCSQSKFHRAKSLAAHCHEAAFPQTPQMFVRLVCFALLSLTSCWLQPSGTAHLPIHKLKMSRVLQILGKVFMPLFPHTTTLKANELWGDIVWQTNTKYCFIAKWKENATCSYILFSVKTNLKSVACFKPDA